MSRVQAPPTPAEVRAAIRTLIGGGDSRPRVSTSLTDLFLRPRRGARLQPPPQRCLAVRDPMSPEAIRNLIRTLPGGARVAVSKTNIEGGVRRYAHQARIAAQYVERLYPRMRGLLRGIDPAHLALAVAYKESTFSPTQVNENSGAVGLLQVMPDTGDGLLADRRLWPDLSDAQFRALSNDVPASLLRPEVSLRVGLAVLAERIEARRGNLTLALADYNAGLVAVNKAGGVPNIKETRDYVRLVPQYREQVAEAERRIIG